LTYLAYAKKPKHVIACCHTKTVQEELPKKRGGMGKKHADAAMRGIRYHGNIQAMLDGSIRYDIAGEFQMQLFTDLKADRKNVGTEAKPKFETVRDYGMLLLPDKDRFAKVSTARVKEERIANDFGSLMEAIG